ncbi:response regulator [Agrobacterium vitis]|uniref:response regulator n=1 Tax=Agrobacterium vitis TaxID=373 RepID=UPI001F33EED1|nr:response regulator [Agrobacterium vitis]
MAPITVLIVEDEPIIRMTVADDLADAGFNVCEAANASDALVVLSACADIRVIFTDIDMPGELNGIEFAHVVRDRWPPIEIIITSGHKRVGPAQMPARSCFFPKPYTHTDIVSAIKRMLG